MGTNVDVLITARARAEAAALSGAAYVEISTVVAALRRTGRFPCARFGVVNDQFDLYACEAPGTNQIMIFAHDPLRRKPPPSPCFGRAAISRLGPRRGSPTWPPRPSDC